jgi:hypothetical protein
VEEAVSAKICCTAKLQGRLHLLRRVARDLLKGKVRASAQWSPLDPDGQVVRFDFAFRDPASGRLRQYCVEMWLDPEMSLDDPRIVEPVVASIARALEAQCGVKVATENRIPLSFPKLANVRMV